MSNLIKHAEEEMKRAGLYEPDSDYGGMLAESVMALVKAHSEQGHSGGSHWSTLRIFNEVINFKPLSPITTEDFVEVSPGTWQCKRASSKFSHDAGKTWHDIDKPLKFQWLRRKLKLKRFAP